jgi:hypothetical protein
MRQKSTVLGMAAAAAFSSVSFPALAGVVNPCTAANWTTYRAGGSNATCTVADKTISGVSVTQTSPLPLQPSDITVNPVAVANDPGLTFDFFTVGTNGVTIKFTIAAPPSDPMTDASLVATGHTFSGPLSFGVAETLSNTKSLSASQSQLSAMTTFAAVTSLMVTDTLSSATLTEVSSVTNQFSETPVTVPVQKPSPLASLALLGVGISALGFARRQKRA